MLNFKVPLNLDKEGYSQVSEVLCIYCDMICILVICFYYYFEEQIRELFLVLPQFDIGNEENPPLLLLGFNRACFERCFAVFILDILDLHNFNIIVLSTVNQAEKAPVQQHTKSTKISPVLSDVLMHKSLYLLPLPPIEQHVTLYLLKWGQIMTALCNLTNPLFLPSVFGKQGDRIKEERIPMGCSCVF